MGRKRKPKAQRKPKTDSGGPSIQTVRVGFELASLEIALGHDGLLRGAPEPLILLSAFHMTTGGGPRIRPLGRELVRFAPKGRFPVVIAPPSRTVLHARIRSREHDRLFLLALALEEDSGRDVERVYARIQDLNRIRVWDADANEPSPVTIGELGSVPPSSPPFATRIHVLDEGVDLRDACTDDEFIGAGLVVLAPHRSEDVFRIRCVSGDRQNDWTSVIAIHIH